MPPLRPEFLIQFDDGKMCAVVGIWRGKVITAAPILRWMLGWTRERAVEYGVRKKWKRTIIHMEEPYRG
jgi:hypothetical protein